MNREKCFDQFFESKNLWVERNLNNQCMICITVFDFLERGFFYIASVPSYSSSDTFYYFPESLHAVKMTTTEYDYFLAQFW
jgi:hypothetical protein